jgi:hypothetical protein
LALLPDPLSNILPLSSFISYPKARENIDLGWLWTTGQGGKLYFSEMNPEGDFHMGGPYERIRKNPKVEHIKEIVRDGIGSIVSGAGKINFLWLFTGLVLGFLLCLFSVPLLTQKNLPLGEMGKVGETRPSVYKISLSLKALVVFIDSLLAVEIGDESWKSVKLEINGQYFYLLPKDEQYFSGQIVYLGVGNFTKEDGTIFPRDQIKIQKFSIAAETPQGKAYGACSWDRDETATGTIKVMKLHLTGSDRITIWDEYAAKAGIVQDKLTHDAKNKAIVEYAIRQIKASQ